MYRRHPVLPAESARLEQWPVRVGVITGASALAGHLARQRATRCAARQPASALQPADSNGPGRVAQAPATMTINKAPRSGIPYLTSPGRRMTNQADIACRYYPVCHNA